MPNLLIWTAARRAAILLMATAVCLTATSIQSVAGVDASLCNSQNARMSVPNEFALPVCFDGKTLIVRNTSDFPVRVKPGGSAGEPYQQPYGGIPQASSLVLTYIRPGEKSLLMPGYQLRIPVGRGAATATLDGTDLATTYLVLRALSGVLPTQAITPLIDAVGQLGTELADAWSQYQNCTKSNGWLGRLGCEALYNRNVAFAVSRAVVHGAGGGLLSAVLNLLDTAEWAASATNSASTNLLRGMLNHAAILFSAEPTEPSGSSGSPAVVPPAPASPPVVVNPKPNPGNPNFTGGYAIADSYFGGTWPRTDPNDGTWHSRGNRPANAASYWWANGLGVGFSCGANAAPYSVRFADGHRETWTTWLRSTDTWGGRVAGLWIPSAVADTIYSDGIPSGMPRC